MVAYQLSIFAENKPGRLAAVTQILAREKINIRATTIATSTSTDAFGVINLIVDDPRRAEQVLVKAGMQVGLKPVLAVLIEDKPGGLDRLTQLLAREQVNVNNAYGFVLESQKRAIFIVDCDQIDRAAALLETHRFQTLDAESLSSVEPFHYMKY